MDSDDFEDNLEAAKASDKYFDLTKATEDQVTDYFRSIKNKGGQDTAYFKWLDISKKRKETEQAQVRAMERLPDAESREERGWKRHQAYEAAMERKSLIRDQNKKLEEKEDEIIKKWVFQKRKKS
jgi:hypothetical protein